MAEDKDIKYPLKSKKYDGVFQRKNGQWFYRIKKIIKEGEEPWVCQKSNYPTEDAAYMAKVERIQRELINRNYEELIKDYPEDENAGLRMETFETVFNMFIEHCGSDSSVEKYEIIYNSLLKRWADRKIGTFSNNELEAFLLKLSMGRKSNGEKYSEGYIDSVRKLITKVFEFAIENDHTILGHIGQTLNERDYKLRVLSLFSGIGAPEQAMKNMGIDFDLINFCEIDKKASKAYCLLHGEPNVEGQGFNALAAKNLNDISKIDMNDFRDNILDPDIVYFGFPCTDLSQLGKQKGFYSDDKNCNFPSNLEIYVEYEIDGQTRSGLLINVLRMVMHKKPKFLIAENVAALVSSKFEKAFNEIILRFKNIDDVGYHVHYVVLNSKEFGVPQSRKRVFMIMVRGDIPFDFKPPKESPLEIKAEDWFEENAPEEYYLKPDKIESYKNYTKFKPNYNRDVIRCITTKWGALSHSEQTFVDESDGKREVIRVLTSQELMRFQGFPPEYGTILRDNGFSKNQVGYLIGNSITVQVMEAVINSLINSICPDIETSTPEKSYIMPLFSYMGNKYRLMPRIDKYLPKEIDKMTFIDLFSGSAVVPINVSAKNYILNDTDKNLISIYEALALMKPDYAWEKVMDIVNEYKLSADNPDGYYQCRKDYVNSEYRENAWYWLLALIYHSFNTSTVQYNQKGEYNAPFGKFKCNIENAKNRFYPYANRIYRSGFSFECRDFRDIIKKYMIEENVFFYVDPPYICGTATYNKNWNEDDERDLYSLLEECDKTGVKWMLSNVLKNKKKENAILKEWLDNAGKKYKVHYVQRDYSYNTYCRDNKGKTKEVIITNY